MVSEEETRIRRFVYYQLRDAPDLSALTLGILKRQYFTLVGHASLSPEAKHLMKRVVQEELMKMQDSDKDVSEADNLPAVPSKNKRKREKENEEAQVVGEHKSRAKKSRHQSSSSEVEEKDDCNTGSEESEEEEQIKKTENGEKEQRMEKSQEKTDGTSEEDINSEEEEINESEKHKQGKILAENNSDGKQKQVENTKSGVKRTSPSQRDDSSEPSEDDGEKEGKVLMEKKDSDSSSLPSLEDEQDSGREKTELAKKKTTRKKDSENIPKGEKEDHKAVLRLKRYISLCGVRRNYKKLLDGCRSVRSKVAVLKKELEDLGVQGQPSIEKCKKARLIREEAEEVAELDVSNIITTQGRPKRRGASVWQEQHVPPSSTYKPTLNSSSDSDEDRHTGRGRRRATDWGNLQGIISDDGDSG